MLRVGSLSLCQLLMQVHDAILMPSSDWRGCATSASEGRSVRCAVGPLIPTWRPFNEPHHMIRIDECGGTNPDKGERTRRIPVRHLVPPRAKRPEAPGVWDQGRQSEEE